MGGFFNQKKMWKLLFAFGTFALNHHGLAAGAGTGAGAGMTPQCDPGWLPYNDWCYLFKVGRPVQWRAAEDECNGRDSSLIRMYTQADVDWVVKQAQGQKAMGYWTALNDNPKTPGIRFGTGNWKWGMNEIANMSIVTWNKSPANDGVSNCAGINLQGNAADIICSAKQGYICSLPSNDMGCPLGWLPGDYNCYWVSNTTDRSQLLNWNDAKTWCANKAQGASLLVVNNASDTNFIMNQLPYLAKTTKVHWIGLQYSTSTQQWGWFNNAPFNPSLIYWKVEPDNVAGIENCVVLRRTGTWSDRDCTTQSNYICMKPQPSAYPISNLGCGNWIRAGHRCYGFMTKQHQTWQGARGYCQKAGGDLVKLDSFDKQSWLSQQLIDPVNDHVYWTGLNDQTSEGSYVWADGTTANTTYINWSQEPNNYKGLEDCGLIYASGEYNDMGCVAHAAAICEIKGTTQCPDSTWTVSGNSCYQFTPYNNVSLLYTQLEAATYCQSFAVSSTALGDLLSVNDATEKAFIKQSLAGLPDNVYGWWTSLSDRQSEGFWTFSDGFYDSSLVDWHGEPSQSPKDDCGLIHFAGAMLERDCSKKIPFICEKYVTGFSGATDMKTGSVLIVLTTFVTFLMR